MLVTLPCVMLLLDYWPLRRVSGVECREGQNGKSGRLLWGTLVLEKVPFFMSIASSLLTLWAQKGTGALSSLEALPLEFRMSNALVWYSSVSGESDLAAHLAVFYPPPNAWPLEVVGAAAIILIALTALSVWFAKWFPELPVGWFWFLGTLVPVIGLVQVEVGRRWRIDMGKYR